jgi:hypothetical protein
MLIALKDLAILIVPMVVVALMVLLNMRASRPWISTFLILAVVIGLVAFDLQQRAASGQGLLQIASCRLLPNGDACRPAPLQAATGVKSGVTSGVDSFVITQEMIDLPRETRRDTFDSDVESPTHSGIMGTPTFCESFRIRNIGNQTVTLDVGPRRSDFISTLVAIAPGERHEITSRDLNEGEWVISDTQRRFYFIVKMTKCS